MHKVENITILFSEEDNLSDYQGEKGWVKTLSIFLQAFLAQFLGKPVDISLLSEASIDLDFEVNCSVLIVVASPKSIQSPTYRFKIQQIISKIYHVAKKERIEVFKVVKRPYSGREFSKPFDLLLPHNFFYTHPLTGKIEDITGAPGSPYEKIFWMKLVDLAHDIAPALKEHKESRVRSNKKTVYLAETSIDLIAERETIRRELLRNGFSVLPNETLPEDAHDLEMKIKGDLLKSDISVHLIGKHYGQRVQGSDRSLIDLQNHLASEYSATTSAGNIEGNKTIKRIIWVAVDQQETDKQQELFIRNIKRDAEALKEAEVLQTSLDELKSTIIRNLLNGYSTLKGSKKSVGSSITPKKLLYLIFDQADKSIAAPVIQYIENNGYQVLTPQFDVNLITNIKVHTQNLLIADVSIIFSTNTESNWLRVKYLDLLKAPGLGKAKPFLGKAIFLAPGVRFKDKNFILDDTMILESNGKLDPNTLNPFLSVIGKAKNG